MVSIVVEDGRFWGFPTAGRIDHNDWLACVIVDAHIVGDNTFGRPSPTMNGLAAAFDYVVDDFVTLEIEVRFDGG